MKLLSCVVRTAEVVVGGKDKKVRFYRITALFILLIDLPALLPQLIARTI